MASENYDFFRFYEDYLWLHVDFDLLQTTIRNYGNAPWRELIGGKILGGLAFQSAIAFNVTVGKGGAIDPVGNPLVITADEALTVDGPSGGQGRWSLIVIRKRTDLINLIDEPLNPTNQVPLNERQSAELIVLDGVLGANAYPATQANDVVLFGLKIGSADSGIAASNIDYSVSDVLRPDDSLPGTTSPYDAVVGSDRDSTHASLNDVMADTNVSNIRTILIKEDQVLDQVQIINSPNKVITIKPGVTLQKGAAATGIQVEAQRVEINRGRFDQFNGGTDIAIAYTNTADYGLVFGTRFNDCTEEVADLTNDGIVIQATQTEA